MDDYNPDYDARLEQLRALEREGVMRAFPNRFPHTDSLMEVCAQYAHIGQQGEDVEVYVYGRVTDIRFETDKQGFVILEDCDGILLFELNSRHIPTRPFERFKKYVFLGSVVGFGVGRIYRQPDDSLTGIVLDWHLLAPSLQLPAPHEDEEHSEQSPQPLYAQLATNQTLRREFVARSLVVRYIRRFLEDEQMFFEVKTPPVPSVNDSTSHESPSMYLKQHIIGGVKSVYEFYNTIDNGVRWAYHHDNQMLECYLALAGIEEMMAMIERLITDVVYKFTGAYQLKLDAPHHDWEDESNYFISEDSRQVVIDFQIPWQRCTLYDLIFENTGVDFLTLESVDDAVDTARALGLDIHDNHSFRSVGGVAMYVVSELIYPSLTQPTFVFDYPIEEYPLIKADSNASQFIKRFSLFINGIELAVAHEELNDPRQYETQFIQYAKLFEREDMEAPVMDGDYVNALKFGLPPTSGMCVGIDRLIMLMTGSTDLSDITFFPLCCRW